MTMIYARIADKTVAEEYFSVTEKVEALYGHHVAYPPTMRAPRCASFAARCTDGCSATATAQDPSRWTATSSPSARAAPFFVTTIEFRPTLQAQRDDAERKGQVARKKIFDGLLDRLDTTAS